MKISRFYASRLAIVLLSVCSLLLFLFSAFLIVSVSLYLKQGMNTIIAILLFSLADALMLSIVLFKVAQLLKFKRIIKNDYKILDCEILGVKVRWPFETVVIKANDKETVVSPWLFIRSYSSFIFKYKANVKFKCLSYKDKYYLISEQ